MTAAVCSFVASLGTTRQANINPPARDANVRQSKHSPSLPCLRLLARGTLRRVPGMRDAAARGEPDRSQGCVESSQSVVALLAAECALRGQLRGSSSHRQAVITALATPRFVSPSLRLFLTALSPAAQTQSTSKTPLPARSCPARPGSSSRSPLASIDACRGSGPPCTPSTSGTPSG